MMDNLAQRVNQFSDKRDGRNLFLLLEPLFQRLMSVALSTAGLVISTTTTRARTGSAVFHYVANGISGQIAASTDMPVIPASITVSNAAFNVIVFTVDSAGTTYVQGGTEGATQAQVVWPELDQKRAIIGILLINPSVGSFVGGTTVLSSTGANTAYISPTGMFDPTANVGI